MKIVYFQNIFNAKISLAVAFLSVSATITPLLFADSTYEVTYDFGYSAGYKEGEGIRSEGKDYKPEISLANPTLQLLLESMRKQVGHKMSDEEFDQAFRDGFFDGYKDGYYGRAKKKTRYD